MSLWGIEPLGYLQELPARDGRDGSAHLRRWVSQGKDAKQNIRYDISAITSLHENRRCLRPVWSKFVKYHVSYAFFQVPNDLG